VHSLCGRRLVARARAETAARLSSELPAAQLGADAAALDEQLAATAALAPGDLTGTGLRIDQAPALFGALTSPRVADGLIGPAARAKRAP